MDTGRDTGPGPDTGPLPDGGTDGGFMSTAAPTTFVRQAFGNFTSPTDAVVTPDGLDIYFAAFDTSSQPAIFRSTVAAAPGDGTVRHAGAPFEYPSGLVMSCDGSTLYIADPVASVGGSVGSLFSMTAGGATLPSAIAVTGLSSPNALAMDVDCTDLIVAGRTDAGVPAILSVPIAGGAATVIAMGGALRAPSGVFVDMDNAIWVLDHLASGAAGRGTLFRIATAAAGPVEVASGLSLGTPAGIAFPVSGGRAIVASRDATGTAVMTIVDTTTLALTTASFTGVTLIDPGGMRGARFAGVFAIVDTEGAAIYRGQ